MPTLPKNIFGDMSLTPGMITKECIVKDIVNHDYRTAIVFEKFGIGYCCGGNWSLETTCVTKGIVVEELISELQKITRTIQVSSALQFDNWKMDFLTDYIINVHHQYLNQILPEINTLLTRFVEKHAGKFPHLNEVLHNFTTLSRELPSQLEEEENIIFPYIRHLSHAYDSNDSYAGLLIKTLRKPIDKMMYNKHGNVPGVMQNIRKLTNTFTAPEQACRSHQVVFLMLRELHNDLVQHSFLENEVLYPKALLMEKELLHHHG